MRRLLAMALGAALMLTACTYYGVPATVPASYDRSFYAAADAMRDQGLAVSVQDQPSGRVVASNGVSTVTAIVGQQADGSVRVQFSASDSRDPGLLDRVSRSYDRRMGR